MNEFMWVYISMVFHRVYFLTETSFRIYIGIHYTIREIIYLLTKPKNLYTQYRNLNLN